MLEQGPVATGKAATSGQGSQRRIVPERPRRESSTTALKVATKTRGLIYPHKGKEATAQGIEDEGQKGSNRGSNAHTRDQRKNSGRLQKAAA